MNQREFSTLHTTQPAVTGCGWRRATALGVVLTVSLVSGTLSARQLPANGHPSSSVPAPNHQAAPTKAPSPVVSAYADIKSQLDQLRPQLDSYPPNFQNEAEMVATQKRYGVLKKQLDTLLSKTPDEPELLLLRAQLQQLGNNMDIEPAYAGAIDDYRQLLTIAPTNVEGLLGFAELLVNSSPDNAADAATLFALAQCQTPTTPNAAAQRGYFFALYYRGKLAAALRQARYNHELWPTEQSQQLIEVTTTALANAGQPVPTEAKSQLPPCER